MADIALFVKDINQINLDDICSCWEWNLKDQKAVFLISNFGDMFLIGKDDEISWLHTGTGEIKKIADNLQEFEDIVITESNTEKWFFASLLEKLILKGQKLKKNEVYSFNILPTLGGSYSITNFTPTDISVHFAITGQLQERIKNLPHGTKINNVNLNIQ
jgi:hypothetical protein